MTSPQPRLGASFDLVEFPSTSASASGAFLQRVFGWTPTRYGPDYVDVETGGPSIGFQSDDADTTDAPLVVIGVDDLDVARAEIEAAGGVVTVEPFDFPGGRRFHFREPGGAVLAVWKAAEDSSADSPEG